MFAENSGQKDRVFLVLVGIWLFTALFMFGNPVILDYLHPPKNIGLPTDIILTGSENYSNAQSYIGILSALGLACLLGLSRIKKPKFQLQPGFPRWVAWLPLIWFVWQAVSTTQTVDREISLATLIHFGSCIAALYLGMFVLARMQLSKLVFWGATLGLIINLIDATQEHFGGLDKARNGIINQIKSGKLNPTKISPHLFEKEKLLPPDINQKVDKLPPEIAAKVKQFPVEMVKRWYSTRVYGHMFYPNAMAGIILLLLPVSVALLIGQGRWLNARRILAFILTGISLACLYWSGSKSGWLISLILIGAWILHFPLSKKFKIFLASAALVAGLIGFTIKYADYFEKGATSVSARFGYWNAALKTAIEEPLVGTGPGTFRIAYQKYRAPKAEPTRLTHNDYLQQASDSGWPGFTLYCAFIGGSIWTLSQRRYTSPIFIGVRLGLLAWALQGMIEFGLYIPALAWPAWLMLGWILAAPINQFDKSPKN
tara:strand:- start:854 stop:2311 length:1458 start_codon:yes stop_codon:yes gene_type:complete